MPGPLQGRRMVEIAAMGPAPFAGMVFGDMGADVVRVERLDGRRDGVPVPANLDVLRRNKRSIRVDLKHPRAAAVVLRIVAGADALIEGFRPGVMERLGLGPRECFAVEPHLVYGRVTGFGQDGPWAGTASHDINCLALGGVLAHVGRDGQLPTPPMGLIGDFGAAGSMLVAGVLAAMLNAQQSGLGQVVDVSMTECSSQLMAAIWGMRNSGLFDEHHRGGNRVDSGAPYYDCYECADGELVAIGALEERFFGEVLRLVGLDTHPAFVRGASSPERWSEMRTELGHAFAARTQAEWCEIFEGADACFAPVLRMADARTHPHAVDRGAFVDLDGCPQPAPAPRFTRTNSSAPVAPVAPGADTRDILAEAGFSGDDVDELESEGVIG